MEVHGFLAIDKPLGWTSHDVVARLRRIVGTRRVGHAGTLDPAATGVLVAGVGRATKLLDYVQHGSKTYIAHIVLGTRSDTADIDGRLIPGTLLDLPPRRRTIRDALPEFTGEIDQVPPKYSALKQGGEPLYKRMRRGETVDVPVRRVRIDELHIVEYAYPDLLLSISCGSGVYIRSLAEDLGDALGTGAYLHHLLRTQVGQFGLEHCWTLNELSVCQFPGGWTSYAVASDAGIDGMTAAYLNSESLDAWYHGRSIRVGNHSGSRDDGVRAYTHFGEFAGLGSISLQKSGNNALRPRIVLKTS